jgi:serine/threonine protein phosphatase PrpC
MEDRIHVVVKRDQNGQVQHVFAGIYDGHGGPQASQYVCTNLYNNIIVRILSMTIFHVVIDCFQNNELFQSETDADIMSAIKEGFQQTNGNFQASLHNLFSMVKITC